MALSAYMQVDGIPGEATDDKHQNWIELLDVQHAIHQEASATATGTQSKTAAKANHGPFVIRKTIDKASPLLLERCSSGASIPKLKIEMMRSAGTKKVPYMTVELSEIVIADVQFAASTTGTDEPGEWVHFKYNQIKWKYTVVKPDGSTADNINGSWNLAKTATAT